MSILSPGIFFQESTTCLRIHRRSFFRRGKCLHANESVIESAAIWRSRAGNGTWQKKNSGREILQSTPHRPHHRPHCIAPIALPSLLVALMPSLHCALTIHSGIPASHLAIVCHCPWALSSLVLLPLAFPFTLIFLALALVCWIAFTLTLCLKILLLLFCTSRPYKRSIG